MRGSGDRGRTPNWHHDRGVVWIHQQLTDMLCWEPPTGRPRTMDLHTAIVMLLFALRQNLATDVIAEIFGCATGTVDNRQQELEILIDDVLTPLYEQRRTEAHRHATLVDCLVAPIGERDDLEGLFSRKKGYCGQNVQVVADLGGRLADVGGPCPGSMHGSRAFVASGIAARWADHPTPDGPGMTGDKGYQGAGINTPHKKPAGQELADVREECNRVLNGLRAAVERAIVHLKCWKIRKTGFRRSLDEFPCTLRTVTRLEMFRVYGLH